MRSVGSILKQARLRKKISVQRLAAKTKIKQGYILALEAEQWNLLPSLSVTQGFVKNIASALGIDANEATAFLRRDFVAQQQGYTKLKKAVWTPRATLITIALIVVAFLAFYLFRQYSTYAAPPPLTLSEIRREGDVVTFSGKTHENAQVLVGDEAILVGDDGKFSVSISAKSGDKLVVQALSRSGRSTKKEIIVP